MSPLNYSAEASRYDATRGGEARVLRPGGHLLTTVDKAAANGDNRDHPSDARQVVTRLAARHGLVPAGETSFVGVVQRGEPVYTLVSFVRS